MRASAQRERLGGLSSDRHRRGGDTAPYRMSEQGVDVGGASVLVVVLVLVIALAKPAGFIYLRAP